MVALARDLHVVTAPATTNVPAVLISIFHVAQACYVRALSQLLPAHKDFRLFPLHCF
jgi:hypothetical protein